MTNKINLVLSCGYARCFAQIGVFQALEEAKIEIGSVTAVGFGSYVGVMISAGFSSKEIISFFEELSTDDFCHANKETTTGLFNSSKFFEKINSKLGPLTFDKLERPLTLLLFDLNKQQAIEVTEGSVNDFLEEENTYPLLYDFGKNVNLINGKVINPLPVAVAKKYSKGPVLAIDVESQHARPLKNILNINSVWVKAFTSVNPILWLLGRNKVSGLELRVMEMMKTTNIDWIVKDEKPDHLIRLENHPESQKFHQDDFGNLQEIVAMGYQLGKNWVNSQISKKS